ncbi:MAG TPA: hypothetical protein DCE78_10095 [Bacteroidetes bacterium]|nr:hypothetical protein [Bacteroidota bacterium]
MKLNISDIVLNAIALVIGLFIIPISLSAQVIDFGSYESSSAVVTPERNLEFGLILKDDSESINLGSGLEGVISIVGIRYLDIIVDFSPFPVNYLYLDGNISCVTDDCRIPFSMSVVYTNAGQILDNVSGAITISGASERFPVLARGGGPPRPPPVPVHSGYTPPTETAYLYFYGSITTSTSNSSGNYWNDITVTVTYD